MRTVRQPFIPLMFGAPEKSGRQCRITASADGRALPILPHAKTSACPVIGQLGNRLDHLFRKCARTFCRYKIADGPAWVPAWSHDLWRSEQC
jgi:hypothetical protein